MRGLIVFTLEIRQPFVSGAPTTLGALGRAGYCHGDHRSARASCLPGVRSAAHGSPHERRDDYLVRYCRVDASLPASSQRLSSGLSGPGASAEGLAGPALMEARGVPSRNVNLALRIPSAKLPKGNADGK